MTDARTTQRSDEWNAETFELANLRLKLRNDLRWTLTQSGGEAIYVVEDPVASRFYQLGVSQYALVSVLDGSTPLQVAVSRVATRMNASAITMIEAAETCRWMLDNGLASAVDANGNSVDRVDRIRTARFKSAQAATLGNSNPLFLKWRWGTPSESFERACKHGRFLLHPLSIGLWVALLTFAGALITQSPAAIGDSLRGIMSTDTAVWLLIVFVGLKLVHEIGHAIACYAFGGRVREFGVVFILFVPVPYVDVTSCWGFVSKRRRMLVSAAGMMVEMAIAAVAAIAWTHCVDPVVRFHLFNIMLTGTLTTLLFNANFLMRFDGYYLLSDVLDLPNLAASASQAVRYVTSRFFLGKRLRLAPEIRGRFVVLFGYGVAAAIWRVVVCLGLAIAASNLLHGFGLILAIASLVLWWGVPAYRVAKVIGEASVAGARCRRHLLTRLMPLAVAVVVGAFFVPWPMGVTAPGVVMFANPNMVRAAADGFIVEMLVAEGESVEAGQRLAVLENVKLASRSKELFAKLEISRLRARRARLAGDIALAQAESATGDAIEDQLDEANEQISKLVLTAPASGTVVAMNSQSRFEQQRGRFLSEGTPLMQIVDVNKKEIVLAIAQTDFETFAGRVGETVRFVPTANLTQASATLRVVQPHADVVTDPRLTATGGGDLAVRPPAKSENNAEPSNEAELVQPHFAGRAELRLSGVDSLPAGSTGRIQADRYNHSIAEHVWVWVDGYLRRLSATT
ncbi:HlyD family secretion protein [Rubripirellula tenax]|uniref:HlyD family secretion protein n=1 Tax=Rubripirellula tenax TaxID=2528015 RepID=A0A5C6FHG1_9BACT|nr:efflux RND transporter periplasmic adaptor subunit [Rubripirellula tenax]TWU59983.1 HlyD family secretion protein [Rubripirellula tenax]